jgi:hypothetical protein
MPDLKVSELTEETNLQITDNVYIVKDEGGGTWSSVKVVVSNFINKVWSVIQSSPETSTTLSSGASVSLDFTTKINNLTMTGDCEIQLPDMSGWTAGEVMRLDLWVKQDPTGNRTLTWASGWKAETATLPTNTLDADAVDRFVIDCIKDLNICAVGLAQSDIS